MPYAGDKLVALTLPTEVTGYGAGSNTITAASYAVLPTLTADATITNPSTQYSLKVLVIYQGRYTANGASGTVASMTATGGITISPGVGTGSAVGFGEIPFLPNQGNTNPFSITSQITAIIPPSVAAVTFQWQAYRDNTTGTNTIQYPTTRVIPLNYI